MPRPPSFWTIPLLYGAGTLGSTAIGFVVSSWLLYFYVPPEGPARFTPGLYGAVALVSTLLGVALTPWIGHRSDQARTPWGRRYPFMAGSILPGLVFFVLMWLPPAMASSLINFLFLFFLLIGYKIATAFYQVPYQALLPDLALNDGLRVRLSVWQSGFLLLGYLLGGLAGQIIERLGYLPMALAFAMIGWVTCSLPLLAGPERRKPLPAKQVNFWHSFAAALRNPAFLYFALTWGLYIMASFSVQMLTPFLVTEVCEMTTGGTVYFYIPAVMASLACYPLVTRLSDRLGKRRIYAASLLASAGVYPGTMLIGRWLPFPLPLQCTAWAVLQAIAISGAVSLSMAFVAEIADADERDTQQSHAGMYFAVIKVFDQVFSGIASLLLPLLLLLGRSRLEVHGPLGVRLVGLICGALMLLAFGCFRRSARRLSDSLSS